MLATLAATSPAVGVPVYLRPPRPLAHVRRCLPALTLLMASCAAQTTEPGATPDPWADRVVGFTPGASAGFGQDRMPGVVLGPPRGGGDTAGSLDVVSLGKGGEVVLAFDDQPPVDGPGPDLIVFENPFSTWLETGEVAASEDGETWHTWPCAADDAAGGFAGCAGVHPVLSHPDNGVPATDPALAGGDAFDLAALGLKRARYVRIRDTGRNDYQGQTGGFDLDAVAVIHADGSGAR